MIRACHRQVRAADGHEDSACARSAERRHPKTRGLTLYVTGTNYNYATTREDIIVNMKYFCIALFLYVATILSLSAQGVVMPDPHLQRAVRSALNLQTNQPITATNLQPLERLVASKQGITDLTGLEHATRLEYLVLRRNDISDLTPLTNLVKLRHLALGENQISDIRPLANLINLRELHLSNNMVTDVSPLSTMINLRRLVLEYNLIEDFTPLTNLTNVINLGILGNPATDYSAILTMGIPHLSYDQCCEIEPLPVRDRIENRDYPSVGKLWGGNQAWHDALNRPLLTPMEQIALHDLWLAGTLFRLEPKETVDGFKMVGDVSEARQLRDEYLALNPNLIFLRTIQFRHKRLHQLPPDSPFWVRDQNGDIARDGIRGFHDFTNPIVQERILSEVRAVDRCGLFDGIFFDWWNDNSQVLGKYRTREQENQARETIIRRVRAETRPDFLVFVNAGPHILPLTGPFVNGTFMETGQPFRNPPESIPPQLEYYAETLSWSESNMRQPHINLLEGWGNPDEPPDSPMNRRWMRVFTTLGLTHSDGYTLFTEGDGGHQHLWYDFWDADLGRPVSEKGQQYQETDGLYIREFTNGWAAYNNSGAEQTIRLHEDVVGVSSRLEGMEHTLPNLDGEMYLRVAPKNLLDVTGDGVVNILDLVMVVQGLGTDNPEADVNKDGVVNVFDLVMVAKAF